MTLQAAVKFKEYFRCYVVGQTDVHIMPYDPSRPHARALRHGPAKISRRALLARVKADALTLCRALGYDLNTVEFAVEDGIPYAIDFMNPAPDADLPLRWQGELRVDRRQGREARREEGAEAEVQSELTGGRLCWVQGKKSAKKLLQRRLRVK